MLIEIAAVVGACLLALFLLAETKGKAILGVFGALILITLALYLHADNVQIKVGDNLLTNESQTYLTNSTNTTTATVFRNETTTSVYGDVPFYLSNKDLITLSLIGVSLFLLFHYGINITRG